MNNEPLNLNVDLSKTDTSMPRLRQGNYACRIEEATIVPKKDDPSKHNLLVIFATIEEGVDQIGNKLEAGVQLRNYYPLQQSDNENAPDFLRGIAALFDAAFKCASPEDRPPLTNETIAALASQEVICSVKLEDDAQYGLSNRVNFVRALS